MSSILTANRYHDISCGHRVVGHENKCRHLHGHNYRVTFYCAVDQGGWLFEERYKNVNRDDVGRVIDFSVIKSKLCMWLEENWDHKMLLWTEDTLRPALQAIDPDSVVQVPFNPTAENMAMHLVNVVGPERLTGSGVVLQKVDIYETRKCSVTYEL